MTLLGGDRDRPGDFPNGIALSPDEKTLYVTAGFRKTLAYDVLPDDTVANPRVFIEAGNDGIKTDNHPPVPGAAQSLRLARQRRGGRQTVTQSEPMTRL